MDWIGPLVALLGLFLYLFRGPVLRYEIGYWGEANGARDFLILIKSKRPVLLESVRIVPERGVFPERHPDSTANASLDLNFGEPTLVFPEQTLVPHASIGLLFRLRPTGIQNTFDVKIIADVRDDPFRRGLRSIILRSHQYRFRVVRRLYRYSEIPQAGKFRRVWW